jgi:cytoskeleton protein RodZ
MATEEHLDRAPEAPPVTAGGPGAQLRAARETAGLSLEQVAQQLKLAPRQVRALEEEDFAQLPGRTFARGFVRNYARLLNLNGEDLLALLPDAARAPALEAPALQSTGAMIAELPTTSMVQPGISRWIIPIVLVACIVGAATYEWLRGGLAAPAAAPSAPVAAAPATATSTELANPFAATAASDASPVPATAPLDTPAVPIATAGPVSPAPTPAIVNAVAAPVAPAAPAPLELTYHGPSWTEIRDRDGQVLISRLVAAGSAQALRGNAPFDIVIGNANAVTLVYRGAPVDLGRYTRQNVARLRLT